MFKYEIGKEFDYIPDSPFSKDGGLVTVVELRKRGGAKLSNGWVVDEDGVAEGTSRVPGGCIANLQDGSDEIGEELFIGPKQGTLERLMVEKMLEKKEGVTFLDFVGTGITEDNIDQIVQNLRTGMYEAETDDGLKFDA